MKFLNDILGQLWTLLGMFIAWLVLEGSARTVVGWAILISLVIWVGTFWIRDRVEQIYQPTQLTTKEFEHGLAFTVS